MILGYNVTCILFGRICDFLLYEHSLRFAKVGPQSWALFENALLRLRRMLGRFESSHVRSVQQQQQKNERSRERLYYTGA